MSDIPPTPLTVGQLVDALGALILTEPAAEHFPVTFGTGVGAEMICGGIVQRPSRVACQSYLNLAPMQLGNAGGF